MEISVPMSDFAPIHKRIDTAASKLEAVRLAIDEPSSESPAMDSFYECVQQLAKLKRQYDRLLANDSYRLFQMSSAFEGSDSAIAAQYAEKIYKNHRMSPAEGTYYYNVIEKHATGEAKDE